MEIFAGPDPTFIFGWWKEWCDDCRAAGKTLDPEAWKAARRAVAAAENLNLPPPSCIS